MHEFSLCEAILKQVAKANNDSLTNVAEVILEIGKLANVDIESLCFWFPVVVKNKINTEITLHVTQTDGVARCNNCSHQFMLNNLYEQCSVCKEFGNYTLVSGQQLLIKSFKLRKISEG